MTQEQKQEWLRIFPTWPQKLFEVFPAETEIQLNAVLGVEDLASAFFKNETVLKYRYENPALSRLIYENWKYVHIYDLSFDLNPNPGYAQELSNSVTVRRIAYGPPQEYGTQDTSEEFFRVIAYFRFDKRVFTAPKITILQNIPEQGRSGGYLPSFFAEINFSGAVFDGSQSLLYLADTGRKSVNIDYVKLANFNDYFQAYKKYRTKIDTLTSVSAQRAQAAITAYRNNLNDKLVAERGALDNLRTQAMLTLKTSADSARRDLVATWLSAQNLRQSILDRVR